MKLFSKIAILLCMSASLFSLQRDDLDMIHSALEHSVKSWNENQGFGYADHYAEEALFINIFGTCFSGKKVIEERHKEILKTFLKGSTFTVTDLYLKEVTDYLVIAHLRWRVEGFKKPNTEEKAEPITGIFSYTFHKNVDKWEVVNCQNTLEGSRL